MLVALYAMLSLVLFCISGSYLSKLEHKRRSFLLVGFTLSAPHYQHPGRVIFLVHTALISWNTDMQRDTGKAMKLEYIIKVLHNTCSSSPCSGARVSIRLILSQLKGSRNA